jgi:hypothetical protein
MPLFTDPQLSRALQASSYGYSGTRIGALGASEYTLVTLAADVSASVSPYQREIEACIQQIVLACHQAPRADNLMLRLLTFDHRLHEVHGFKPLTSCAPGDYDGCTAPGGSTALYDGAVNAVEAATDYADHLGSHGLTANGIVFVLTDGCDNASTLTAASLRDTLQTAAVSERLESLVSILVGVNIQAVHVGQHLLALSSQAGFDHYLELDKADAPTLAGLAAFVSRSVRAQSVALGSGSSQLLTF